MSKTATPPMFGEIEELNIARAKYTSMSVRVLVLILKLLVVLFPIGAGLFLNNLGVAKRSHHCPA